MLSVRSLLVHWPWLSADVREAVRSLEQRDPYPAIESADMLMRCAGVDLEDASALDSYFDFYGLLDQLAPMPRRALLESSSTPPARSSPGVHAITR